MANEISDKVEVNGKAVLKYGAPRGSLVHYFDGCHAEPKGLSIPLNNLSVKLGIAATKAGYKVGEEFEYTIIIPKKE